MTDALEALSKGTRSTRKLTRPLGILVPWRLQAYGYTIAAIYAVLLAGLCKNGFWIADSRGFPVYSDFTLPWIAGVQALNGDTGPLYDPAELVRLQEALVGPKDVYYPNWPYPPIFLLALIPFAMLPYVYAFVIWSIGTLTSFTGVVYLIVRRAPAIALVLASPLTVWTLYAGQNAFLWGSLLGAALLLLERRPVLAGVFIGCLTYKPQFGILFPVALLAGGEWRAFGTAAVTGVFLVCASIAAFGISAWEAFPNQLAAQNVEVLVTGGHGHWGYIQTVYGLIRALHGGAAVAWFAQGVTAMGVVIIVYLVWRSSVRYPLKAAALSAAALIATPYAFATDLAAIAIPVAFLASDQMRFGLVRGEQTIMIAAFVACFVILATSGSTPLGPVLTIALLAIIVQRAFWSMRELAIP